uniref:hypothetical protein n=1 Tax=Mangrovimonas sp. TPBH4 TaxID=1645914 RepID=UPI000AAD437D
FAEWVALGSITGGCNLMVEVTNPGAPDACGGSSEVIWTATSDCGAPLLLSSTFTVEPAPEVSFNAPEDYTMAACSDQASVDQAFAEWVALGSITGGCNLMVEVTNPGAPDACGGSPEVIWTATSDCGAPLLLSSTFTVEPAPEVSFNAPDDYTMAACSDQASIDQAFAEWVALGSITGGCNLMVEVTNPGAPDACGGSTEVIWTATSD